MRHPRCLDHFQGRGYFPCWCLVSGPGVFNHTFSFPIWLWPAGTQGLGVLGTMLWAFYCGTDPWLQEILGCWVFRALFGAFLSLFLLGQICTFGCIYGEYFVFHVFDVSGWATGLNNNNSEVVISNGVTTLYGKGDANFFQGSRRGHVAIFTRASDNAIAYTR